LCCCICISKFPNDVDAFINPHSNRSFSSPSDSDDNVKGEEFDVGEGPPPLFDRLVVGVVSTLPSSTFFNVGFDVDVDVDVVVVVGVVVVLVVVVLVDGEGFRSTGGRGSLKTKPSPSRSSRAMENNRRLVLRRLVVVRAGGRRCDDMTMAATGTVGGSPGNVDSTPPSEQATTASLNSILLYPGTRRCLSLSLSDVRIPSQRPPSRTRRRRRSESHQSRETGGEGPTRTARRSVTRKRRRVTAASEGRRRERLIGQLSV
jgi:hypothetical protein